MKDMASYKITIITFSCVINLWHFHELKETRPLPNPSPRLVKIQSSLAHVQRLHILYVVPENGRRTQDF